MRAAFSVILCLPLVLTGCSLSSTAGSTPDAGVAIQGIVHGGQQPLVGAQVYLFAANNDGYGQPSLSLLNSSGSNTTLDSSGGATNGDYFVTTGANGQFTITGDYSCTANTQVYLFARGGNPGLTPSTIFNNAAGLLAVLGNCPGGTNVFATSTPVVIINEVTTIAAVYAFSGFAVDATHVSSSGSPQALIGIQNAFANAANLAQLSTGFAVATSGSVTAPTATTYTLANILAACINTDGTISGPTSPTPCYTLLHNALSAGTTGTVPTESATAAINMAHNPGANISALYGLVTGNPAFQTGLPSQPNDFTLGLQLSSPDMNAPQGIAIDANGSAWITNNGGSSVTKFSSSGSVLSRTSGYTGGGLLLPDNIAIDLSGNAWVTNYYGNDVTELSNSGVPTSGIAYAGGGSPYTGGGLQTPYGIAIDGTGNVWVSNYGTNTITELNSTGATVTGSPHTGLSLNIPYAVAIDSSGNVWIASKNNNAVTELNNSGAILQAGYSGGGIDAPYGIAIDGSNHAWVANYGGISNNTISEIVSSGSPAALGPVGASPFSESGSYGPQAIAIDGAGSAWVANNTNSSVAAISSSGTFLSPSAGYFGSGTVSSPDAIAVDPSGNVWVANNGGNSVTELIGAAAPVVTPLAAGAKNGTLGSRP